MAEKRGPRKLLGQVGRQVGRRAQRVRPLRTSSVEHIVAPSAAMPPASRHVRPSRASRLSVRRMPDRALHLAGTPDGVPAWIRRYGTAAWFLIGIVIVIGMVVFATARIQAVFIAVFLALVVTSVLYPIVSALARRMPRPLATLLTILGAFLVVAGLFTYVISSVAGQWPDLARQFQNGMQRILDYLESGPLPIHVTQADIYGAINSAVEQATTYVQQNATDLASQVLSNAGAVALVFTILALSLFLTIFFLARGSSMWLWFLNQLPAKNRERTHLVATAGWYTFSGYARGTMIVAIADGIMAFILLTVVGVPLAAPLAVLVVIGAFIPLIGAPAAMIVAGVVALAAGGFVDFVIVILGVALIGQIEGHILQPLVMGRQVSLHPVVVAVGVTAGTFLAGLIGAIIAIPILAVTWAVYSATRDADPPLRRLPDVDEAAREAVEKSAGTRRRSRQGTPEAATSE